MHIEHHRWHSPRLGYELGVAVFGHWGPPLLAFPTSHGDEWELERHGLVGALSEFVDAGRVKIFCVGSNNSDSFMNRRAHPSHRSWRHRLFDEYVRDEVVPFIHQHCQTPGIAISTMGASLGAYHAAATSRLASSATSATCSPGWMPRQTSIAFRAPARSSSEKTPKNISRLYQPAPWKSPVWASGVGSWELE